IMTGTDAAEFMLCGAQAVMVGTANFADPLACPRIVGELEAYLVAQKVRKVEEIVGALIEN
ncbi:MAG: dihydroorotate dehydrogenase, partial [Clostridia bacterium]|nr:dihydroorotate dehydrogenase [Clostridia bacterium]